MSFQGSIAQENVNFPIESVIEPLAGEQYSRAMVYIPISQAAEYLSGYDNPQTGALIELNSSNYGTITSGDLKSQLVPFFTKAQAASVGIAIYNDAQPEPPAEPEEGQDPVEPEVITNTLSDVYQATKYYAYFKFGLANFDAFNALQVELAQLCAADTLYSALWIGISDTNVLTKTSALVNQLNEQTGLRYRLIYNPDTTINAALAQLGVTLASANQTGTPVGNDVDFKAFNTIGASGSLDADGNRQNLSATDKATLDEQKIGYVTWVGDGTSNVVVEGSLYNNGDSVGAEWIKAYITYMCKVKTANFITQGGKFRNNSTYQAILTILRSVVNGFLQFGRLANFVVSAPPFSDLPKTGDTIVINNAWKADYIDQVRSVTVYGTLYIQQPSK